MKVELAGAAAFACLGLIAGALLRPQPADFRPDPASEASGFTGPPTGPAGGAAPDAGWRGIGPVPDYVVGTDSLQPPPGYVPPIPAWEEPAPAATPPPSDRPSDDAAPAPSPTPAPEPSPSQADRPKEGE